MQLVCTGALTNAALLLTLYPEVSNMVDIVIMGGCLGIGARPSTLQCGRGSANTLFCCLLDEDSCWLQATPAL